MIWVRQEEPNGCVAATLAMILGVGYWQAADLLREHRSGDGCYSTPWQFKLLRDRGWHIEQRGRTRGEGGDLLGAYPPAPFADAHLVSVRISEASPVYHSVVWLRDGGVLDPLGPEPRSLVDYHHVGGISGLFPPAACPRA